MFVYKLSGCGFESRFCHLNSIYLVFCADNKPGRETTAITLAFKIYVVFLLGQRPERLDEDLSKLGTFLVEWKVTVEALFTEKKNKLFHKLAVIMKKMKLNIIDLICSCCNAEAFLCKNFSTCFAFTLKLMKQILYG